MRVFLYQLQSKMERIFNIILDVYVSRKKKHVHLVLDKALVTPKNHQEIFNFVVWDEM